MLLDKMKNTNADSENPDVDEYDDQMLMTSAIE